MIPNTDWFPWNEVEETDRGYGTMCWIWTRPLPPTAATVNVARLAQRLFRLFVGEKPKGQVWMHLCERHGEMNLCVRPDHVVVASKGANNAHWVTLRRAAGTYVSPLKGTTFTDEHKERMSEALRVRIAREKAAGPYVCESCGQKFSVPGRRTHHRKVCS